MRSRRLFCFFLGGHLPTLLPAFTFCVFAAGRGKHHSLSQMVPRGLELLTTITVVLNGHRGNVVGEAPTVCQEHVFERVPEPAQQF